MRELTLRVLAFSKAMKILTRIISQIMRKLTIFIFCASSSQKKPAHLLIIY